MTAGVVREFGNYGLLGLLLLMLCVGVGFLARWCLANVVRPWAAVAIKSKEKADELLAALGMTVADTHRGVTTLLVSREVWEGEFQMLRNGLRLAGDALVAAATIEAIDASVRERLDKLGERMLGLADEASRVHKALTPEDERNARNRR